MSTKSTTDSHIGAFGVANRHTTPMTYSVFSSKYGGQNPYPFITFILTSPLQHGPPHVFPGSSDPRDPGALLSIPHDFSTNQQNLAWHHGPATAVCPSLELLPTSKSHQSIIFFLPNQLHVTKKTLPNLSATATALAASSTLWFLSRMWWEPKHNKTVTLQKQLY